MRLLYVGDVHATPSELDECGRLMELVLHWAKAEKVDAVVLLGDQYHTHSVVHLPVMAFWDRWFRVLAAEDIDVIALVGNHDRSGVRDSPEHALMLHEAPNVTVVEDLYVRGGVLFLPYMASKDAFVALAQDHAESTSALVCHQTFNGAVFENGFEIPDGVDPNLVPQRSIISGHIHKPQRVGKVWYPGAPRWRSVSDANTERALWVVEHADDGTVTDTVPFTTAGACTPIVLLEDRPESPAQAPRGPCRLVVDVYGPPDWVEARKKVWAGKDGVRVRLFPDAVKGPRVKESDGVPVALRKYLTEVQPKHGTAPQELARMAEERISWLKSAR
jgi:predicted phosphodiesterase